jgi:hypothetical protein
MPRSARWTRVAAGTIHRTPPLPPEIQDGDRLELPRIALTLDQHRVGDLFRLIGAINALESSVHAASPGLAPT